MQKLTRYRFHDLCVTCPVEYTRAIVEVFFLDIYRTNLIRNGDNVLDLGAGIGDFSLIASKHVNGKGSVIAIEPSPHDFGLLKRNIEENNCKNITAINIGVGNKRTHKDITYSGRHFRCKVDTLESIYHDFDIKNPTDFIKMDIEGAETEVVSTSMHLLDRSRVLSLELHGTKKEIDKVVLPYGYGFYPITMKYIYKKIISNSINFPRSFIKSAAIFLKQNQLNIHKVFTGFEVTRSSLLNGTYIKADNFS